MRFNWNISENSISVQVMISILPYLRGLRIWKYNIDLCFMFYLELIVYRLVRIFNDPTKKKRLLIFSHMSILMIMFK